MYHVPASGTRDHGKLHRSAARVTAAAAVKIGEEGTAPASFWSASTSITSPDVTMRMPNWLFASVWVFHNCAYSLVSVTVVHVVPPSSVMSMLPVPETRRKNADPARAIDA